MSHKDEKESYREKHEKGHHKKHDTDDDKIVFAYIPVPNREEARTLGRYLIEMRLAACVNILDGMESIYPWEGKIETGSEALLIAKTSKSHMDRLAEAVLQKHSYDVPCIQFLKTKDGNPEYVSWLRENLD